MIIDTEDAVTLSHLNPMERQMLRNLADRLAMLAWQRVGWMGEPGPIPAKEAVAEKGA
ncbi:MAG: hypothetical protein NVV74_08410 [Magnetospirillum sp.]|nr:hypothetical protein [Magnetospirillum sp.]